MNPLVPNWIADLLESEREVAWLLDHNHHITSCNRGWDKFALSNGGVGISGEEVRGRFIFDFVPDVLVTFYERKYFEALQNERWVGFDYECSSPEVFRIFHMAMHPVDGSRLLVVNSYLPNRRCPVRVRTNPLPEPAYLSPEGSLTMCANCRRTQRQEQAQFWDFVPAFLRQSRRGISHSLCPKCTDYFYPDYEAWQH